MTSQSAADKRALKLAKKVLGNDFKKLMKQKYLIFPIKILKGGHRVVIKKIYLFKHIVLFTYTPKTKRFARLCSVLIDPRYYHDVRYSKYDKLIAYYLWLKHYTKHRIENMEYNDQFNLMPQSDYSREEVYFEIETDKRGYID